MSKFRLFNRWFCKFFNPNDITTYSYTPPPTTPYSASFHKSHIDDEVEEAELTHGSPHSHAQAKEIRRKADKMVQLGKDRSNRWIHKTTSTQTDTQLVMLHLWPILSSLTEKMSSDNQNHQLPQPQRVPLDPWERSKLCKHPLPRPRPLRLISRSRSRSRSRPPSEVVSGEGFMTLFSKVPGAKKAQKIC
ncbi:hypothetical protein GBA52_028855 [Prunus armeniaca]|nr:hypothetical protein GBA52_028855 [Prunus armeniaca]